ncbi:MAG: TniB family NTP-binding protein [Verrucomicrobia bacterium]|nr:TniB family NTP-binding protein [Verrucomicrobiota bacterium]
MNHLLPQAAELLELSDPERIKAIRVPKWINYPRAMDLFDKLEDLFTYPSVARMPSLLIWGDSNAGKSMLVTYFCRLKNASEKIEPGLPVLMVEAPATPSDREFFSICLERLCAPHKVNDRLENLRSQLSGLLRSLETRMLIIDEVHNLLAGSGARQRAFLNTLRRLSNGLQIGLVAVGTEEARNAFRVDPQMANRFEPVKLPRWEDGENFRKLLFSFEVSTPLRNPSHLASNDMALRLMTMSEGLLGEVARIISRAAVEAVRTGREQIDAASLKSLNWIPPSARRECAFEPLGDEAFTD